MPSELRQREDALDRHLEAALQAADDEEARYHLRESLQLRIAEKTVGRGQKR